MHLIILKIKNVLEIRPLFVTLVQPWVYIKTQLAGLIIIHIYILANNWFLNRQPWEIVYPALGNCFPGFQITTMMVNVPFASNRIKPNLNLNVATSFASSVSLTGPRSKGNAQRVNSRLLSFVIKSLVHRRLESMIKSID